jgi:hypothetical protein
MKTYTIALFTIGMLLLAGLPGARAQSINEANKAAQPAWGPSGYDTAHYYYLPDMEAYYSVANHQFIYLSDGRWVFTANLPPAFAKYDLYSGYKVVINQPRPYLNFNEDRVLYKKYKGLKNKQRTIKDDGGKIDAGP